MPKENKLLLTRVFIVAALLALICLGPMPDSKVASAQTRPEVAGCQTLRLSDAP